MNYSVFAACTCLRWDIPLLGENVVFWAFTEVIFTTKSSPFLIDCSRFPLTYLYELKVNGSSQETRLPIIVGHP